MKKEAIMSAKKAGIQINQDVESVEIAFTGDTTIKSILANEKVLRARILVCELTEVDINTDPEPFHRFGHVHIKDILDHQSQFKNEYILFGHFASK